MIYRLLKKSELNLLGDIDRREIVNEVYHYKSNKLRIVNKFYNIEGWNLIELNQYISMLKDIYERHEKIYGVFKNDKIVGIAALESKLIGEKLDQVKLDILYISNSYWKHGVGKSLVKLVSKDAVNMGAKGLYISATPFKNTVDFYFALGARVTNDINRELFDLEPLDIHMILDL